MEIQETVIKYRYHLIFTLIFATILVGIIFISPSFMTILAYFWPLFLSTALFLAAVVFFGKTSSSPAAEYSGDKAAEGLLDYVAATDDHHHHEQEQDEHNQVVENFKNE